MSVAQEKKFVIRHTFTNVLLMEETDFYESEKEKHFNVEWLVYITKTLNGGFELYLECPEIDLDEEEDICMKTKIDLKVLKKTGEETFSGRFEFSPKEVEQTLACIDSTQLENYLINGNLTVECHVRILNMTVIKEFSVSEKFNESNKEVSDVVLVVEDQKFYVSKLLLAFHSSYFKSLLLGQFAESKQSEVELKDIDPQDFQNYLEIIYAESFVQHDTVEGILKLADMYDSKTVIKRCEEFLLENSQKKLKETFEMANNYKLDKLMEKCLSEIKTEAEMKSLIPENPEQLSGAIWKKLLEKSFTLPKIAQKQFDFSDLS